MTTNWRRLLAVTALVAACTFAHASDAEEVAARQAAARRAYADAKRLRAELLGPGGAAALGGGGDGVGVFDRMRKAEAELRAAFERTPIERWSLPADGEIVDAGLALVGDEPHRLPDRDVEIGLWDAYLARMPSGRGSSAIRTAWLPSALAATGDLGRAVSRMEELVRRAPDDDAYRMLLFVGDVWAASGSFDTARAAYARAQAAFDGRKLTELARRDPATRGLEAAMRERFAGDVRLRGLVGTTLPDAVVTSWAGPATRALSAMRGSVVVLRVGAVRAKAHRDQLRALDALHDPRDADAVGVLALTSFDLLGADAGVAKPVEKPWTGLPAASGRDQDMVQVSRDGFPAYAELLRKRLGVGLPVGIVDDGCRARIAGIDDDVTFVLDRDGAVSFVARGDTERTDGLVASFAKAVLLRPAAPPK